MKPKTTKYIIIIAVSAAVVAAAAIVFALTSAKIINTANNKLYEDLASWGIFIGLVPLIFASIYLHLGRKVYKRSSSVIQRYKNMGNGVYVQGYYGNKAADKFEKSGLTAVRSEAVDAPVINEFPICLECEFIEYQGSGYGCGVIGKVVNVTADERVIVNGRIDMSLVNAIAFDPYTHGYYKVSERVGEAFKDGLALKK